LKVPIYRSYLYPEAKGMPNMAIPFRLIDCFQAAFMVLVLLEYFRL